MPPAVALVTVVKSHLCTTTTTERLSDSEVQSEEIHLSEIGHFVSFYQNCLNFTSRSGQLVTKCFVFSFGKLSVLASWARWLGFFKPRRVTSTPSFYSHISTNRIKFQRFAHTFHVTLFKCLPVPTMKNLYCSKFRFVYSLAYLKLENTATKTKVKEFSMS